MTARTVIVRGLCLFLLLNLLSPASGRAQAFRVKDLNTTRPQSVLPLNRGYPGSGFAVLDDVAYFRASDGIHGVELWQSDGTQAGTRLVVDLCPGSCSSHPDGLMVLNGELFFEADDGLHGPRLWKSDGTAAGTAPAPAAPPPAPASSPSPSSRKTTELGFANGLYFFLEWGGEWVGWQIWVTDLTEPGTQMLWINQQKSGLVVTEEGELLGPRAFFDLNGTLLFPGDNGSTGAELWKSDGTAAGTSLVKDSQTSSLRHTFPGEFTRAGGTLFYRTGAGTSLEELWKTDGTPQGTQQLLSTGHLHDFGIFGPRDLTAVGDLLLFATAQSDNSYEDLWKSDGTPAGTELVLPPVPILAPPPAYPTDSIVSLGNVAFFRADAWWNDRYELWRTDGTEEGTASLDVPLPFRVELREASAVRDGVLLFATSTPEHGEELWQSDGTEEGTFLLAETVAGPDSQPLGPFATAGPAVFFAAGGDELWKNDAGGTAIVRALPGNPTTGIRSLTAVGNRVYFSYDDGVNGRELWVSDGTEAGTRMVEDLFPGPGSSHPRELEAQGSILVFSATDGVHGVEPWRSNGTAVGTRMLQDIAPGALPSSPTEFTASGPNLYFGANDGTTGFELWAFPHPALLATFADVPADAWSWSFVETLVANGLTQGCAPDLYCPGQAVTRAEAAVFLLRGIHGAGYVPPPGTGTRFTDVPATHWAVSWIEQFAAEGITSGCAPGLFCPSSSLTRAELAVFLLRAKHGAGYVPPPATGTRFTDVPANHWVGAWIEQLAAEGITSGCAENLFCPGRTVTRAEMAAFLVRTFGLATP